MQTLTYRGISWPDLEALQAELQKRVAQDPREQYLLFSEPAPTFTHGPSGRPEDLLWQNPLEKGIQVFAVSRGGKWTYHGPGQVLIYPIVSLPSLGYPRRGVRKFVGDLAAGLQAFLSAHQLESEVRDTPFGLYLPKGKVASFGLAFRNGISSHGVAMYLESQQAAFQGIVPCGVPCPITSLAESGVQLDWNSASVEMGDFVKRSFQAKKN